jgi:hypothetical protein
VARQCVFCGGTPLTREHVIPQWLTNVLPEQERFRGQDQQIVLSPPKAARSRIVLPHRQMRQPFNAVTVKAVCTTCNSGWMNDIEAAARPHLTGLIDGQRLELNRTEITALATWVFKTALMAQLTSVEGIAALGAVYRTFYVERIPPEGSVVWVAGHGSADWALRFETVAALVVTEEDASATPSDPINTVSTTLGLGHILFNTVFTARHRVSYPPLDEIHPAVSRLWPAVDTMTVPKPMWLLSEVAWIISRSFAIWMSPD